MGLHGCRQGRIFSKDLGCTGYAGMMRNVAVALGNAPYQAEIVQALAARREEFGELVQVHVDWALEEQLGKREG